MTLVKRRKVLQVCNIIFFVAMVVVNLLANLLPLNGKTTGEISAFYPNLFTPAGFTFSIWGVIYVALTLFVLYQAGVFFKQQKLDFSFIESIGFTFVLSSLANMAWLLMWHYQFILSSLIIMVILLFSLIGINKALDKRSQVCKKEYWFVHVPFRIYLGWISVATIANVTVWLVDIDWQGFGLSFQAWTIVAIVLAAVLAFLSLWLKKEMFFSTVVIWAYIGILAKHVRIFSSSYLAVIYSIITTMVLVSAGVIYNLIKYKYPAKLD